MDRTKLGSPEYHERMRQAALARWEKRKSIVQLHDDDPIPEEDFDTVVSEGRTTRGTTAYHIKMKRAAHKRAERQSRATERESLIKRIVNRDSQVVKRLKPIKISREDIAQFTEEIDYYDEDFN